MIRRRLIHRLIVGGLTFWLALSPAVAVAGDPIDVGATASDRSGWASLHDNQVVYTTIEGSNTANDTGVLNEVEIYLQTNTSSSTVYAGTFYENDTAPDFKCRDSETLGILAAGSKQIITGLSVDIQAGDRVGASATVGAKYTACRLENDGSGGTAIYMVTGEYIDPGDSATFTTYSEYTCSLYGIGEAASSEPDISNSPDNENLGSVAESSTYYAHGSAPSNPVQDSECSFTVTNNSGAAVDIDIKGANWTGGDGWSLASGSPGSNETRMTAYYSGQDPSSGVVLTTSNQGFITSLADSATKKWDFKVETGTFTDGVQKSTTITLTASLS